MPHPPHRHPFAPLPLPLRTAASLALASALGCSALEARDDRPGIEPRAPKADLWGSCRAEHGTYCGGKSNGTCWCTASCDDYGDCCADKGEVCDGETATLPPPRAAGTIRIATFNLEDVRTEALADGTDARLRTLAATIQAIQPDLLFLNELAYDAPGAPGHVDGEARGQNAQRFADRYLAVAQRPELAPLAMTAQMFESNTGVPSGFDLDNDGAVATAETALEDGRAYGGDAWGFGEFPGQYAFALLVREEHTVHVQAARTFRELRWSAMPGALAPTRPASGEPWYDDDEWQALRLSSKNHVVVPVELEDGTIVHALLSHPTPPAFDGPEGRNRKRNHDEIRLWADLLDGADYVVDDGGQRLPLPAAARFVILGDLNSDPDEGASIDDPVGRFLLRHPRIQSDFVPLAPDGGATDGFEHLDADDTAQFGARIDYVIPSRGLEPRRGGVVRPLWPEAAEATDHFPVWIDVEVVEP